jgi:hypothetical protein
MAIAIGGKLFLTTFAGVFFYVRSYLFRNLVFVPNNVADNLE